MIDGSMNRLLGHLHRAAACARGDGELLACFIERREEDAFTALVRRHGPMVLGVCRRVLGNPHDADDAFQATFLVLARKAASVRPRAAVGNWLYGVAYRTALAARGKIVRRRAREKQVADMPHREVNPQDSWHELLPLLDRELARLPDIYRLPVVLCDVEGRSRKEVARQLAVPEGTLSSRLTTARRKLAARLARHGFTLGGGALAVLLGENAAPACMPAPLMTVTVKAALWVAAGHAAAGAVSVTVATLTEGVLKTMFLAKLKTVTVVLLGAAALGLGAGGLLYQGRAGAADPAPGEEPRSGPRKVAAADEARPRDGKEAGGKPRGGVSDMVARAEHELRQALNAREQAEVAVRQAQASRARAEVSVRLAKEELDRVRTIAERTAGRGKGEDRPREDDLRRRPDLDAKARPQPRAEDRLDQILKQLDRLEKRLERLERRREEPAR